MKVPEPYTVMARWGNGEFARRDDQTLVASAPPPGCHPLALTVSGVDAYDWDDKLVVLGDPSSDCG